MITTKIQPFTTSPNRSKPATFSEDMDTRLGQENSRIIQMNAMSDEMNQTATSINEKINEASQNANAVSEAKTLILEKVELANESAAISSAKAQIAAEKANICIQATTGVNEAKETAIQKAQIATNAADSALESKNAALSAKEISQTNADAINGLSLEVEQLASNSTASVVFDKTLKLLTFKVPTLENNVIDDLKTQSGTTWSSEKISEKVGEITKESIGLGNVPNYTATSSVTDSSASKFATAKAVNTIYSSLQEIGNVLDDNQTTPTLGWSSSKIKAEIDAISTVYGKKQKFYVDEINGNDENDGLSETTTFKTLPKAIESVIYVGDILLLSDITLKNPITLLNKKITIYSKDTNSTDYAYNKKINITIEGKKVIGFRLFDSSLILNYVDIVCPLFNGTDGAFEYTYRAVFSFSSRYKSSNLTLFNLRFFQNSSTLLFFDLLDLQHTIVLGYRTKLLLNKQGVLIKIRDRGINLFCNYDVFSFSNGIGTNLSTYISGIVRDSNGVPRNVISNMIL